MSQCERNINCLECSSRGMCNSYALFKYEQGREDAINEYKEQLLENLISLKDEYFDLVRGTKMPERYTHLKRMYTVNMIIEMVKIKAEQLKEQK